MGRVRLDRLVVDRGLAPTRERAQRLILAGEVLVDEAPADKPGTKIPEEAEVRLRRPRKSYVGRGGEKLAGALDVFELTVEGRRVLDVGASTGGFTDCLLQRGAASVTAVDVGRGQLDWRLVRDPRVEVRDEVNARYLEPGDFSAPFDLVTVDVSFISAVKILPALARLLSPDGHLLVLVKPQFELRPEAVERGGLVRDPELHLEAILAVATSAGELGLAVADVAAASIKGASGNQEFFVLFIRSATSALTAGELEERAREVVGLHQHSERICQRRSSS